MSSPVLVLGNDFSRPAAKTSRHLCRALERLGRSGIGRDTRLIRWAAADSAAEFPTRCAAFEQLVVAKWHKFIFDYGIETVISLDLNWLVSAELLATSDLVQRVHSFWAGDVRSSLRGSSPTFPLGAHSLLEVVNGPKVTHYGSSPAQSEELRVAGMKRVLPSMLAAPAEYLDANAPWEVRGRIAFIGGPGFAAPPTPLALKAIERGDSLVKLRKLARQEMLENLDKEEPAASWLRACPQVGEFLAAATELRLAKPSTTAGAVLMEAGKTHSDAFEFLSRANAMLDATALVKAVHRYDRPALVVRLWRRGWLDVLGAPERWAPYGISARPAVAFADLPATYRRYAVHLNVPGSAGDMGANERLFEIAACGRVSLNLDSLDLRVCYSAQEIAFDDSAEGIEATAAQILKIPDTALAMGEKARLRTAQEHLWEHRLKKALA